MPSSCTSILSFRLCLSFCPMLLPCFTNLPHLILPNWLPFDRMFSFSIKYFFPSLIIRVNSSWIVSEYMNILNEYIQWIYFQCYLICFWLIKQSFCACFFFFIIVFRNILTTSLLIRNTRLIVALTILTGVPMTVVNEQRETPVNATVKTRKVLFV